MSDRGAQTLNATRARYESGRERWNARRAARDGSGNMMVASVNPRKPGAAISMVPLNRTFAANDRHRLRTTPAPMSGLADNFLSGIARKKLSEECRQAARRFTLAKAMRNRMADLVVADGFLFKMTSSNAGFNAMATTALTEFLKAPTIKGRGRSITQVLRGNVHEWAQSGDQIWAYVQGENGGVLQEIEGDRITNPGGSFTMDTANCVGGVETDDVGRPIGFYVQSRAEALSSLSGLAGVTRVDAADAFFSVNPIDWEVGQTRGVPFLAAAVPLIELLETYVEDQARAAKMATFLGFIFKTESGQNPLSEMQTDLSDAPEGTPDKNIELQTGYSVTLAPNETVEQLKPEYPTPYARDFASLLGMQASASMGLPLILVLLDPSQTNYHGFRSAIAVCFRQIGLMQEALMEQFKWLCERKLADLIRDDKLPFVPDWNSISVSGPSLPSADFGADVDAWIKAVAANLATEERATQELGTGEAADIRRVRAMEVKDEAEKGITPQMAGAAVVQKGIPK
jgi:capsid protein